MKSIFRSVSFLLLISLSGLLSDHSLFAQQRSFASWRTYVTPNRGTAVIARGDQYFAATSGGVLEFDRRTGEIRQFTTIEGLTAIDPTTIAVDPNSGLIFLGYEDGSINYFADPNDIKVLTDIKRSTSFPDRRINRFAISQGLLYVATNFGLVVYDLQTLRPVADAAQFGDNPSNQPVSQVAVYDGRIYLLLEGIGVFSIDQDFPNLRDPTAWQDERIASNLPPTAQVRLLVASDFGLYAQTQETVLEKQGNNWAEFPPFAGRKGLIHATSDFVASTLLTSAQVIDREGQLDAFNVDGAISDLGVAAKGEYALVTAFSGMFTYSQGFISRIQTDGPGSNNCVRIAAGNGELYVAPVGYDRIFVPTPRLDGIYYYNHEQGNWKNIDALTELPPEVNEGFARAYYDPTTRQAYLGSFGEGIVVLKDGVAEGFFNCTNSTISSVNGFCNPNVNTLSRVSGITRDLNGNLWVSMDRGLPPLIVQNPEGEWFEAAPNLFPVTAEDNHITDLMVDSYGTVWMVNWNRNLYAYTSNGTPFEYSDGRLLNFGRGLNQGGLPSDQVFTVAEDRRGFIWVGTAQGVSIIFDPFSVSQGQIVDGSEPVIENRGLLSNTSVNAIAIDGGNRKWIGTDDGAYLVSENGDRVLFEFNTDNSPLLANRVTDIAIDQGSGEVYFATTKGIISYQGDAVQANSGCDEITVYPNPVFTDYDGLIGIRGMAAGSIVKITTLSGLLVTELESQGGLATWDGRDNRGQKVRSGIYLTLIAGPNGEEGCTGKFVVIDRQGQ